MNEFPVHQASFASILSIDKTTFAIRTGSIQSEIICLIIHKLKRMLRRKPTAIILTSEDVAAYEDSRTAKAHSTAENERSNKEAQSGTHDPNDELKPLPGDKSRAVRNGQSRDERIGVTR